MTASELFLQKYKSTPSAGSFCPYRICPLGAHVDHNKGKILGAALDRGISFAYSASEDGKTTVCSAQFDGIKEWDIHSLKRPDCGDWADYLRGACLALKEKYDLQNGVCGAFEGSLPIGGLSSSAAVTISFLRALCSVNGITLPDGELISTALTAENKYVGVSCGKLDQSCEVLAKKDGLLYLDTLDDSYEIIKKPPEMPQSELMIIFSGVEHSLVSSAYNMRVDECKSAAYSLLAYAGLPYGKYRDTVLRDVPRDVFESFKSRLPDSFRKRAEHWFTENDRVEKGRAAYLSGDLERFGALVFESGASSINLYETGGEELTAIYNIMTNTSGIYGGRFSGAGFKGCCIALCESGKTEEISAKIRSEYLKMFPSLSEKFKIAVCKTADGVGRGK